MIFRLGLILLFCFHFNSFTQMVDDMGLKDFKVTFSESYLKKNRIKSVTGHTSYKKELQPIIEKGLYNRYYFDKNGILIELVETFNITPNSKDSSITSFAYDNRLLEEKKTISSNGEHSYKYTINSDNKVEQLSYLRGGVNESKTLVFEEFYTYEKVNDTTEVKWYLNRYGKPYQKEIFTYNQFKYLLSVKKKLIFGGNSSEIIYAYDSLGRLIEFVETKGINRYKTTYKYDSYSNLIEKDYYKNDVLEKHEELIYDSKTLLVKALLSKDVNTNTIYITKYTIEFY